MKIFLLFISLTILSTSLGLQLSSGVPIVITPPSSSENSNQYFFNPPVNTPGQIIYSCESLSPSTINSSCQIFQKKADARGFPTVNSWDSRSDYKPKAQLVLTNYAFELQMISFLTQSNNSSYKLKAEFVPHKPLNVGDGITFSGYVDGYTYFYLEANADFRLGSISFDLSSKFATHLSQILTSKSRIFPSYNYHDDQSPSMLSDYTFVQYGLDSKVYLAIYTTNQGEYTLSINFQPVINLENEMSSFLTIKPQQINNRMYFQIVPIANKWLEINLELESENQDERFNTFLTEDGTIFSTENSYKNIFNQNSINKLQRRLYYVNGNNFSLYLGVTPLGNSNIQVRVTQNQRYDLANFTFDPLVMNVRSDQYRYFSFSGLASKTAELTVAFTTQDPLNICIVCVGDSNYDYPQRGKYYSTCSSQYSNSNSIKFNLKANEGFANYSLICQFEGQVQLVGYNQFTE